MALITVINNPNGTVEAHAAGCQDVAKKSKKFLADSWDQEVSSERELFLDYNADFIDEANGDESNTYSIKFFPCCNLPKETELPPVVETVAPAYEIKVGTKWTYVYVGGELVAEIRNDQNIDVTKFFG